MSSSHEQFGEIYSQYVEKIYRFVYLKVNSQEIAEDLTSQVFLRGFESYKKAHSGQDNNGEPIRNMGAFLYKIANNAVVDHYREKGRTKVVPVDLSDQLVDDRTNTHEMAIINSEVHKVKSALKGLKKDYQDVILWHYLEDIPIEEISQIIDKPPGTVRVMLHRGLKALKNELRQEA